MSRPPAGTLDAAAGSKLRAIDTLLADRGQLFRALFLTAPIPKALVDLDGHLLVVNDALCSMTGRAPEDMVGRHLGREAREELALDHEAGRLDVFAQPGTPAVAPFTIHQRKPMPTKPFDPSPAVAIWELTPTTLPRVSTSGPPELPGLIAASVWMNDSMLNWSGMAPSCRAWARCSARRRWWASPPLARSLA